MKNSILAVGNNHNSESPRNLRFSKSSLVGKKPCARDGHTANIFNVEGKSYLLIFGGDRHLMPFNDIFLFDINYYLNL